MRIAIVVYDHADEKNIALANDFISAGHCVKFVYFKRNATDKLPKEAILTVLDCKPSIFAAINPKTGLRQWIWEMKRWSDTDLVLCKDKKLLYAIRAASFFGRYNPHISQDFELSKEFEEKIEGNRKLLSAKISDNSKLLVVEYGGVGDLAERFADIKLLKKENPTFKVWLMALPQFEEYAKTQSHIDGYISGYKKPLKLMFKTAKKIRAQKFDWMSDLVPRGGHSAFLQFLCNVPKHHPRLLYRPRTEILIDIPEGLKSKADQILSDLQGKKVIFAFGSGTTDIKKWPTGYWAELAKMLAVNNWKIVLCGNGEDDLRVTDIICDALDNKNCINLVNKTSLPDLIGIASQCQACVGNDTGLLHIAALAGVPSIGLFSQPTAWRVGLRMPWFHEIHATNEIKKFRWENKDTEYVLDRIKPEEVYAKFRMLCENQLQENSNDK